MDQEMMDKINEIRQRHQAMTPGPYYWHINPQYKEINMRGRGMVVLDFRRYGMRNAAPCFLEDGIIERADKFFKVSDPRRPHREAKLDHPDAQGLAHSWGDIDYLLQCIDQLTGDGHEKD